MVRIVLRPVLRFVPFLAVVILAGLACSAGAQQDWRQKVDHSLPLLGHRNWILIVDSAYPLQSSSGVETIETNAGQLEVLRYVLGAVNRSIHVRPDVFLDAELPFVPDADAPGASAYREQLAKVLAGRQAQSLPHEKLIGTVDEAGKLVHVLVLKTTMTVPYSSVFLRLNCRYWSDDAEKRMRAKMAGAAGGTQ